MGKIEREIILSEKVRPSSPTPRTLKTYMLPMLDQVTLSSLVPVALYFPSNIAGVSDSFISHTAETLQRSLSLTLSRFYPLAGRVSGDGHSIDCNDEGVPFVVARFRGGNLSDHVLENPNPNFLGRLLPCEFDSWGADQFYGGPDSSVVLVQANFFDCGGVVVAAVFWHKAVDVGAIYTFISSWAATARGSWAEAACPNFISQSLFSHKEEFHKQSLTVPRLLKIGNAVLKRYVFDAAAVAELKAECGGNCTRVEAVLSLIWKCFMAASLANNVSVSVLNTAVNLRRRAEPPFPPECFGNWTLTAVAASRNEREADLEVLSRKIRDSIRKMDGDFVKRLCGDGGAAGLNQNLRRAWSDVPVSGGAADILTISSWCGVDFYSVDFGWGKPTWLTGTFDSNTPFVNVGWLREGRNGNGIEAWVNLDAKYMSIFDKHSDLRR